MAYTLKPLALSPGSINLLPPGDQVAEGDALELTGWWPATAGKLTQTRGLVQFNFQDVGNHLDSLCQVGGKQYYGGAGGLSMIGRDHGSPTWYIDSGYDSNPLGLISSQGYCWIMNRGKQRKDDGSWTSNWTTETPVLPTGSQTAAAGAVPAGAYQYYVTFENKDGHEGNPSPSLNIQVAVDGSKVTINRPTATEQAIQQSPSTGGSNVNAGLAAYGWNVYRKSPGTVQAYKVNQNVLVYATASYDDVYTVNLQDDFAVIAFGVFMRPNHDPAPAAKVIANQTYNDRVVVANSAAHPNRIWYTNALEPSYFPGSAGAPGGNWVDCGTDLADEVLAMSVRPGLLIIYRRHSIWRLVGDFADPNALLEPIVPDFGIVGVRALTSGAVEDYAVGDEGVYAVTADWPLKLSQKIEPVIRSLTTPTYPPLNDAQRGRSALGLHNGRLWFSYPDAGGTFNSNSLIFHVESKRWMSRATGFGAFSIAGPGGGSTFVGAGNGKVYTLEPPVGTANGTLDDGGTITLAYQSAFEDAGLPDHPKTWADLVVTSTTLDQTLTVKIRTNNARTANDSFTLDSVIQTPASTRQTIPLVYPAAYPVTALAGMPIKSYNLSVRIEGQGSATEPGVEIDAPILLHYYQEARFGVTFDTGPINHGKYGTAGYTIPIRDPKDLDILEIDMDAQGQVNLQIFTDLPGPVLAPRLGTGTGTVLLPTSGRQTVRYQLAAPGGGGQGVFFTHHDGILSGRLFRYLFTAADPTQPFAIYGLRARLLPIGVYLDGTQGDRWVTQPLAVGV